MSQLQRRQFFQTAVAAAAAAGVRPAEGAAADAAASGQAPLQQVPHGMAVAADRRAVVESPRRTPVVADVDVLVVGGGPTGVGAALAAARGGAKTLLVERHGMLGGVWTAGLLNPLFDAVGKGWIVRELIERLQSRGAWLKWKFAWTFDTEAMKSLLEEMMAEAGVDLWYYSSAADAIVEDGRLRGVVVESKSGREAILARVVVDCTGDGDVAARAGVPYRLGRAADGQVQPMTLMFEVEGVDRFVQKNTETLYDAMTEIIARDKLDIELPFSRVNYAPWIIHVPRSDTAVVQATHVYRANALDARSLTAATIDARRQAHRLVEVLKRIPELKELRIVQTAAAIGVREARRLAGRYSLELDDLRAGRRFDDAVTFGAFGVDIHEVTPGDLKNSAHHTPMRPYEIPYRCLLPQSLGGLIFAGRCISGSHEAHASYRVTGTCMGMGQAAGLAAAIAAAEGRQPADIDGPALRRELANRSVGFLPHKPG